MFCGPHSIVFYNNTIRAVLFQKLFYYLAIEGLLVLDIFTCRMGLIKKRLRIFFLSFFTDKNQCFGFVVKKLIHQQVADQTCLSCLKKSHDDVYHHLLFLLSKHSYPLFVVSFVITIN